MNLQTNNRTAETPTGSLHPVVVPILPDARIQGEPNGKINHQPLTIIARDQPAGLSLEGGALTHALSPNGNGIGNSYETEMPKVLGNGVQHPLVGPADGPGRVCEMRSDSNGGDVRKTIRIRNPKHRAKAERFWENLSANRKQPGNCCRCGKPHGGEHRQCDKCRVRVAALKARRQVKQMTMAECVVMVKQCRREVTKLREIIKQMKRHYEYRRNKRWKARRTLHKYADAYPTASKQELAEISHAYDARGIGHNADLSDRAGDGGRA